MGEIAHLRGAIRPPRLITVDLPAIPEIIEQPIGTFGVPIQVREAHLLESAPSARLLGKLEMEVATEGWKFPTPSVEPQLPPTVRAFKPEPKGAAPNDAKRPATRTRLRPSPDTVVFKDRLLYLLQPPLEDLFAGKQVRLPFKPYPYQTEGIAFLMPRHAALLADEMGLGKTMQSDLSLCDCCSTPA